MNIRLAKSDEVTNVFNVHSPEGRAEEMRLRIRRWILDCGCVVAEIEGVIVGYAALEYSLYENGFVPLLLVRPEHRRRGIGSRLMRAVEPICRTSKLFTSTNESNRPMQNLLMKIGYTRSGDIENIDEGDSELVYFKRLDY